MIVSSIVRSTSNVVYLLSACFSPSNATSSPTPSYSPSSHHPGSSPTHLFTSTTIKRTVSISCSQIPAESSARFSSTNQRCNWIRLICWLKGSSPGILGARWSVRGYGLGSSMIRCSTQLMTRAWRYGG